MRRRLQARLLRKNAAREGGGVDVIHQVRADSVAVVCILMTPALAAVDPPKADCASPLGAWLDIEGGNCTAAALGASNMSIRLHYILK